MTIGERIAQLRKKKGMKQTELATFCGGTKQDICKYETDRVKNIPLGKVELIAKALDVSPCYIMGWDESCEAKETYMNKDARKVAEDYLALDAWGKKAIRSVIDNEKARCKETEDKGIAEMTYGQNLSEKEPDTPASSASGSGGG